MISEITKLHSTLTKAFDEADQELFEKTMKEREELVANLSNDSIKLEVLNVIFTFDKELNGLIKEKKDGLGNYLLNQQGQLKAVNKYENF